MKRFIFLAVSFLLVVLLFNSSINAEFNQGNATIWLSNHIVWWSQAYKEELSFATIVLNSQQGLTQLNNKMDSQTGCFPKANCNTKDTALATLALRAMNLPIDKQLKYLNNSLKAASFNKEEWNIQVVTNEDGKCTVKYEENPTGAIFNFNDDGNIAGRNDAWINFNELNGFNFNKALEEINVECDFISVPKISIIKIIGNSFYIIEEKSLKNANFKIENGCYSTNPSSITCDLTSSFYVSWVLKKLNADLTTENYLISNSQNNLHYAIMAGIDNAQLANLISKQNEDGSFDSSIYITSFAFDALENSNYANEKNKAQTWVESKQTQDGKIGNSVLDTAVALYLIYNEGISVGDNKDEGGPIEGCQDDSDCQQGYTCNPLTQLCMQEPVAQQCNQNLICETSLSENSVNCPIDCYCGDTVCDTNENTVSCSQDCKVQEQIECGNNICEVGESISCPIDCQQQGDGLEDREDECGNGECRFGEDKENCPEDCEPEKKARLWWLWLIIIILALGGIIFFVLIKLKKGKEGGETPSYLRPRFPPSYPQQQYRPPVRKSQRDEGLEMELDKSITEAQELLKKKK